MGAAMANFVLSQRALNLSRGFLRKALEELGGESFAAQRLEAHAADWEAIEKAVKEELLSAFEGWGTPQEGAQVPLAELNTLNKSVS